MSIPLRIAPVLFLLLAPTAHAINTEYAKKLERSGCTQVTELQGCDINKTKAENAKAAATAPKGETPRDGQSTGVEASTPARKPVDGK